MKNFKLIRGDWGMELAQKALLQRGFEILRREWRFQKIAEIDYLVFSPDTSRFYLVEVKTHQRSLGDQHSIISPEQIRRLRRAALVLRAVWRCAEIDLILIWVNPLKASVEFFENPC